VFEKIIAKSGKYTANFSDYFRPPIAPENIDYNRVLAGFSAFPERKLTPCSYSKLQGVLMVVIAI
jgi:hypothetical protein